MDWNESIIINTNINYVWSILNDESYMHEIKPQVVESVLIPEKSHDNIKVYYETYQEGKRSESYELTLTTTNDSNALKKQTFNFVIANMIESNGFITLEKVDDNTTKFTYSGYNKGLKFIAKVMMKLARKSSNDKVILDFLTKVKEVSERK